MVKPVKLRAAAGAWPFAGAALTATAEPFRFFLLGGAAAPTLPAGLAPLRHLRPDEAQPVLLLRPTPSSPFSDAQAYGLQALRAGAAELAHREGHLSFERHQVRGCCSWRAAPRCFATG
ncbi:hypothetical protein M8494_11030 [Serratia ureilytica]